MTKAIIALILSLISITIYAEEANDPVRGLVQQSMATFIHKNRIPGVAVELYVNGKLHEQYFGYANPAKKEPVIRKTIFEIGSLSKVMTSLLLAQEVDWAKMSLSDPLTKYVKELPESLNKIKLQDLATHTSGLAFDVPDTITTQDGLIHYLKSVRDNSSDQWRYSNIGIGLLGYALERSTESDYADLYRRHILNPLRMVNGVTVPKALMKYYAEGYDANGNPVAHYVPVLFPAAGAVKASAADMQRFLSAAIGLPDTPPRVFYPMRLTQSIFIKRNNDYQGLGWLIHSIKNKRDINGLLNVSANQEFGPFDVQEIYQRPFYSGNVLIDKTGGTSGFRAYIAVIPDKKSGIVILVNKSIPTQDMVKAGREILFKVANLT